MDISTTSGIWDGAITVHVSTLNDHARVPAKATSGSAGFDLHAIEHVVVNPGESRIIGTGVAFAMPAGTWAEVRGRSGLAFAQDIWVFPGTIDSDYRGEVSVLLRNFSEYPYQVVMGERIAQLVFHEAPLVRLKPTCDVAKEHPTQRANGGLGSTGRW